MAVDAGFSCPHRNGRQSGGCAYCGPSGSRAPYIDPSLSVAEQIGQRAARIRGRAENIAVYFQAYTNTDAPAERLRALYDEALGVKGVVMLIIGTRPDCLGKEAVEVLRDFAGKTELWVEIGLQTADDRTLKRINRGHDSECFFEAAKRLKGAGLHTAAHVIIGLPGEDRGSVRGTAEAVAEAGLAGVKVHSMHIVKGSALADEYENDRAFLGRAEYISMACDFLERIPPGYVVGRLTGEAPRGELLGPEWCLDKQAVLRAIEEEFASRGSRQGSLYKP